MELKLDLSKEYGIVLEGGGAKGAYQIGAWKALREAGVKIKGISGVSVGALNGAFICMDRLKSAEKIWGNLKYSKVMDIDDELAGKLLKLDLKSLSFSDVFSDIRRIVKEKGIDVTPLRNLIKDTVDEDVIRDSARELFVTTFSITDRKLLNVDVKTMPPGEISDILLASAYFPVFRNEKLGGKKYTDGGGFNNVPLDVLIDRGYQDIIVIRIYGVGLDTEKRIVIPDGTNVYRIAPMEDLGGMLEFDVKKSRRNMKLGYLGAKRLLYGLEGRHYFIDAPYQEPYYFDKMMSELEFLKISPEPRPGQEGLSPLSEYRVYTERIFPEAAKRLKLGSGWNYKKLYLAILEDLAIQLKINRYHIYTVDTLVRTIRKELTTPDILIPFKEK